MPLFSKKRLIVVKKETTYGVSAEPTASADALLVRSLEVTPLNAEVVSRDLIRSYYGNSEQLVSQTSSSLSFEVELAGSGTSAVPKYDAALRACGLSPTGSTYSPVSSGFESATVFINIDGVLHKFLGCRGTVSISCTLGQIPTLKFDLMSLYNEPTDTAALTPTYALQATPLIFREGNTPTFSIYSNTSFCLQSFEFNLANEMVYRELVNCTKQVLLTDRKPAGSVTIEAPTASALTTLRNFFNAAVTTASGGISLVHGTAANNTVTFTAPQVNVTAPTYSEQDGIVMMSVPYVAIPTSAGNNEFSLAFT